MFGDRALGAGREIVDHEGDSDRDGLSRDQIWVDREATRAADVDDELFAVKIYGCGDTRKLLGDDERSDVSNVDKRCGRLWVSFGNLERLCVGSIDSPERSGRCFGYFAGRTWGDNTDVGMADTACRAVSD